jgi:hypothetical protein
VGGIVLEMVGFQKKLRVLPDAVHFLLYPFDSAVQFGTNAHNPSESRCHCSKQNLCGRFI